jgi:hypothetical protein
MIASHTSLQPDGIDEAAEAAPGKATFRRGGHGRRGLTLVSGAVLLGAMACTVEEITEVDISSVSVFPASANAIAGETFQLNATVLGELGNPLPAEPEWSSDAPDIATVDATGMVTAVREGVVTVRATYRGASGDAAVRVFPGPGIELSSGSVTFIAQRDGDAPAPAAVFVTNGGTGTLEGLRLAVTYEGDARDWVSADLDAATAPTRIVVQADPTGLGTGRVTATVEVLSSLPDVTPRAITVAMEVTDPPPEPEPPVPPDPGPDPDPDPDPDPGPECTKDSPDWPSCKSKGKKGSGK